MTTTQSQSTARLLGEVEAIMAGLLHLEPGSHRAERIAEVRSLIVDVRAGEVGDLAGVDELPQRFLAFPAAANAVARLVAEAYRIRADAILAVAKAAEAEADAVTHASVARPTDDLILAAQIAISRSQDWVSLGEYAPPLSHVLTELHRRGLWMVADLLRDRSVLHYGIEER